MEILETPLVRKLSRFVQLSAEELSYLQKLQSQGQEVRRHSELISEGENLQECCILLEGWACSYKLLHNGKRQIISFPLAGDFLGLRSCLLRASDHSVVTLTAARVSRIPLATIQELIEKASRLGLALLWASFRDEAVIVEHLVDVGRRSALERTAHFLLELRERLRVSGLASGAKFQVPVTQDELADALGLTAIHVNRVLRQLRVRGLVSWESRQLMIHDLNGLAALAHFDGSYLNHDPKPE